jgi:hypothetical protein
MTEARALRIVAALHLPASVSIVQNSTVAKGIVTGQAPPAPDGIACVCAVNINVSSGPR